MTATLIFPNGIRAIDPRWCRPPPANAPHKELRDLFDLLELEPRALPDHGLPPIDARLLRKGCPLFHEGAPVERLYFIRSGTFKVFRTDVDGYEQVLGFAGRTEVLGFDALCLDGHPTTATALEDSSVLNIDMRDLMRLRNLSPDFDMALQRLLSAQLMQLSELAELMAAVAAEVRLARFLLHLSARMHKQGESASRLFLRMSRRDIASFLGVAIETVSRSFAVLAQEGYLRVEKRDVEIVDFAGLKACARATRRPLERSLRALPAAPLRGLERLAPAPELLQRQHLCV